MRSIEERIHIAWVNWTNDHRPLVSGKNPNLYLGFKTFEELEQAAHDKGMGLTLRYDDPRRLYRNMEIVIVNEPNHLAIGVQEDEGVNPQA